MWTLTRHALVVLAVVWISSCGGGSDGSGGSPTAPSTTPTAPAPAANRAPVISSATVNPPWGISTLTTHAFSASATDPDGDSITYRWDFGNGTSSTNSAASVTFNNANTTTYQATLTVTDTKGASTTSTASVVSTTMAGQWTGMIIGVPISTDMTQFLGGIVTGTFNIPAAGISGEIGPSGAPGKIQANGQFELRFKARTGGAFTDFYYRGAMDPTGRRLTGTLQGSGFTGEIMELVKP